MKAYEVKQMHSTLRAAWLKIYHSVHKKTNILKPISRAYHAKQVGTIFNNSTVINHCSKSMHQKVLLVLLLYWCWVCAMLYVPNLFFDKPSGCAIGISCCYKCKESFCSVDMQKEVAFVCEQFCSFTALQCSCDATCCCFQPSQKHLHRKMKGHA